MEETVRISVIVPVYKVEKYLAKCVDSILSQTYRDLEVILVDDGSPDSCGTICDAYARQDSRVVVIHKENGGLSSARNAGMDIAKGEYIAFVDSDDWIEPEMYGHMLALAKKYDVSLVCAGRYDVSEKTGEKKVGLCPQKEECISGEELVKRIFLWDDLDSASWDKLYHRSLLEGFRYPLGKIVEDVPVTYKIALKAGKAALCDRPFYNYFHRAGSITTQKAITEKSFHYTAHTAEIYPWIQENHPELVPQAAYLRVQSLVHILFQLDQTDKQTRDRYGIQRRALRKSLRGFVGYLLTAPYFGFKDRITYLLLAFGLYRPLRPLFHR